MITDEKVINTAIVLAAGRGNRMKSDVAKQYMLLDGKPILYYSLKAFEDSFIDNVILVTGESETDYCKEEIVKKYDFNKVTDIVSGGKERYHSVFNGLRAAGKKGSKYVYIHDGARPFVDEEILLRLRDCAALNETAIASMPVKDTIKLADEDGVVTSTPNRRNVYIVQTPQTFSYKLIYDAYNKLIENEEKLFQRGIQITDDAMVVETMTGKKIKLSEGSYENIKITTPEDLDIAKAIIDRRKL